MREAIISITNKHTIRFGAVYNTTHAQKKCLIHSNEWIKTMIVLYTIFKCVVISSTQNTDYFRACV